MYMKNKLFIFSFLLSLLVFSASSQDFNVVPKIKSFETGIRYIPHSSYDITPTGWNAQFEVAWQVSGFKTTRNAYISVPLGFGTFFGGGENGNPEAKMLHYGWSIIHNISKEKKSIPFVSYSLLLNQLWLEGMEGHTIGHETRFDFGYNIRPDNKKVSYIFKIEYSHMTFPSLLKEKSDRIEVFSFKTGIRF